MKKTKMTQQFVALFAALSLAPAVADDLPSKLLGYWEIDSFVRAGDTEKKHAVSLEEFAKKLGKAMTGKGPEAAPSPEELAKELAKVITDLGPGTSLDPKKLAPGPEEITKELAKAMTDLAPGTAPSPEELIKVINEVLTKHFFEGYLKKCSYEFEESAMILHTPDGKTSRKYKVMAQDDSTKSLTLALPAKYTGGKDSPTVTFKGDQLFVSNFSENGNTMVLNRISQEEFEKLFAPKQDKGPDQKR